MQFLPVLRRELLVRARMAATYRMRLAVAGLGAAVCILSLLVIGPTPRTGGKTLFESLIAGSFVLVCASSLVAAESVIRERREGTLGLLLVTRVNTLDLLIGKFGSSGLMCCFALLALAPVFVLPILAGGVTGGETLRKSLALLNGLCLALSIGLYASSAQRRQAGTRRRVILLVMVLVLLPLVFSEFILPGPWNYVGVISPVAALISGGDYFFNNGSRSGHFWGSLLAVQVESWLLMCLAARALRRRTDFAEPAPTTARIPPPLTEQAEELRHRHWRSRREGVSPVEWLVLRQTGVRPALWGAAAIVVLINSGLQQALFGITGRPTNWWWLSVQLPNLASTLVAGALIVWASSRFLMESRRNGSIETLLTTPAGFAGIVTDQHRAISQLIRLPMVLMMVPPAILTLVSVFSRAGGPVFPLVLYFGVALAQIYISVTAMCVLSLVFATSSRSYTVILTKVLLLAKIVPYMLNLLLWSLLVPVFGVALRVGGVYFVQVVVQAGTLVLYVGLLLWARRRLYSSRMKLPGMTFVDFPNRQVYKI